MCFVKKVSLRNLHTLLMRMPGYFLASCPNEVVNQHGLWNTCKDQGHGAVGAAAVFLSNFWDTVDLSGPSVVDSVIPEK